MFKAYTERGGAEQDIGQSLIFRDLLKAQEKVKANRRAEISWPADTITSKKKVSQSILRDLDSLPITTTKRALAREDEPSDSNEDRSDKRKKTRYSPTLWKSVGGRIPEDEDDEGDFDTTCNVEQELEESDRAEKVRDIIDCDNDESRLASLSENLDNGRSSQREDKAARNHFGANLNQVAHILAIATGKNDRSHQRVEEGRLMTFTEEKHLPQEGAPPATNSNIGVQDDIEEDEAIRMSQEEENLSSECSILKDFDAWEAKKRAL